MATSYNHGTVTNKKGGFTYMQAYGKDDSNYTGSAEEERGNTYQKGSVTDLSHTLKGGVSAHQAGYKGGGTPKNED